MAATAPPMIRIGNSPDAIDVVTYTSVDNGLSWEKAMDFSSVEELIREGDLIIERTLAQFDEIHQLLNDPNREKEIKKAELLELLSLIPDDQKEPYQVELLALDGRDFYAEKAELERRHQEYLKKHEEWVASGAKRAAERNMKMKQRLENGAVYGFDRTWEIEQGDNVASNASSRLADELRKAYNG